MGMGSRGRCPPRARAMLSPHLAIVGWRRLAASRYTKTDYRQVASREYNLRIIERARATAGECPAEEMYTAVEGGLITETQFLQTLADVLFTNVDVTSAVLAYLLTDLAINKGSQDDLRAEIAERASRRAGEGAAGGGGGPLDGYLSSSDTLLEHSCMESIRLCPPAWFTFPECSQEQKVIDGFRIPARTPVIIDWKRLNTASDVWNSSPATTGHTFEPRRFRTLKRSRYRYGLLRFGIGPRRCIGKDLAHVTMKLFLVLVLPQFDLDQVSREGEMAGEVRIRDDKFTITPRQILRLTTRV